MSDQPGILRFGIIEVHFAAGDLRKNGMSVRLQEQPKAARASPFSYWRRY
jgi:hypothetical protein